VNPSNNNVVEVVGYPGAYHSFDRLMIPVTVADPFANQGSYLLGLSAVPTLQLAPGVAPAYASRSRVVNFFKDSL
jgi:hypothetical protein